MAQLEQRLQENGLDIGAWEALASLQHRSGELKAASRSLRSARRSQLTLDTNAAIERRGRLREGDVVGKLESAEEVARLQRSLAAEAMEDGLWEDAERSLHRVLHELESSVDLAARLGSFRVQQNVELQASAVDALADIALAQSRQRGDAGMWMAAVPHLRRVVRLLPDSERAQRRLATAMFEECHMREDQVESSSSSSSDQDGDTAQEASVGGDGSVSGLAADDGGCRLGELLQQVQATAAATAMHVRKGMQGPDPYIMSQQVGCRQQQPSPLTQTQPFLVPSLLVPVRAP